MRSDSTEALRESAFDWSAAGRPHPAEPASGDSAVLSRRGDLLFVAIIDVLGHGPEASVTADDAAEFLEENWGEDLHQTMLALHELLRGTRGAAVGIGIMNLVSGRLEYVGVGNPTAKRLGPRPLSLPSTDGVVGQRSIRLKTQSMRLEADDILMMASDGVCSRITIEDFPQARNQSAAAIARTMIRRFSRPHDDATCLIVRSRQ